MVFDAATALDTATDMVDPQPRLVEFLVRHVLLPRKLLPQIEINSNDFPAVNLAQGVQDAEAALAGSVPITGTSRSKGSRTSSLRLIPIV